MRTYIHTYMHTYIHTYIHSYLHYNIILLIYYLYSKVEHFSKYKLVADDDDSDDEGDKGEGKGKKDAPGEKVGDA